MPPRGSLAQIGEDGARLHRLGMRMLARVVDKWLNALKAKACTQWHDATLQFKAPPPPPCPPPSPPPPPPPLPPQISEGNGGRGWKV